jgi:hypothetical protein
VTEWWDNKPDLNTADTISLAAGATRTAIAIHGPHHATQPVALPSDGMCTCPSGRF